jgi:ABC-type branched-subunit amino acid transport system substrate-binding protein
MAGEMKKVAVADPAPVIVGVMLPLTGPLATAAALVRIANKMAAREINDAEDIRSLGGTPLQLIFIDDQGRPEVAIGETERTIHM